MAFFSACRVIIVYQLVNKRIGAAWRLGPNCPHAADGGSLLRRFCPLLLVFSALLFTGMAKADDYLVNGDFEASGPVGSNNIGAMWNSGGSLAVVDQSWQPGFTPYSGAKAVGVVAPEGVVRNGNVSQVVNLDPGEYTIKFSGWIWLYTPPGNQWDKSDCLIQLMVDGETIDSQRYSSEVLVPNREWYRFEITYTGQVNSSVRVMATLQAKALVGTNGLAAMDNLSLSIAPALPPRPGNYLVNGGFEQAGPDGSTNMGPGWTSDLRFGVAGRSFVSNQLVQASPIERNKGAGLQIQGDRVSGQLSQFVFLQPGFRLLTLRGRVWVYDERDDGNDSTILQVQFIVDGVERINQMFFAKNDLPNGQWSELSWNWSGEVKVGAALILNGHAGGAFANSYAGIMLDDWSLTDYDNFAPTRPVVVDEGSQTGNKGRLWAAWTSTDAQSGIKEYRYSIGTSPGLRNIVDWTYLGASTSVTRTGLNLQNGQAYFFNVQARDNQGNWSQTGSSDGITYVETSPVTIGQARLLPDGSPVKLLNKAVPVKFGDEWWVQEDDRSAGIKVSGWRPWDITPLQRTSLTGRMGTVNGERVVLNAEATPLGVLVMPRGLAVSNRALGGESFGNHTPGVTGGTGPNNVGLYVTVYGRVTAIGNGYYYLDDGSGLLDGSQTAGLPNRGVRIIGSAGSLKVGDVARISGASTVFLNSLMEPHRAVRPLLPPVKLN